MLVNDVSLRNLIPAELAKGFGFLQSKPASAFSPVAVTPDELGDAWRDGKVHLPLVSHLNGALFGRPNAGVDMTFSFPDADRACREDPRARAPAASSARARCRTRKAGGPGRPAAAGGIGYSCIAEQRTVETILDGRAEHAVHALRRSRPHRDVRRRRTHDLRRDRPGRAQARLNSAPAVHAAVGASSRSCPGRLCPLSTVRPCASSRSARLHPAIGRFVACVLSVSLRLPTMRPDGNGLARNKSRRAESGNPGMPHPTDCMPRKQEPDHEPLPTGRFNPMSESPRRR